MGAWGTGIFSDDLAADVRGDWRDAILDGEEPPELTRRLIEEYEGSRGDPDEAAVFWMALAAAQMETGRLEPDVRDRALAIIDGGGDVRRWADEDPPSARQRERVLARLAEKLRGPQPGPKRLRRPKPPGIEFELGDAVRLRNQETGAEAVAVVVDTAEGWPRGRVDPVVELLLWEGGPLPSESELATLPPLAKRVEHPIDAERFQIRPHMWVVASPSRKQAFGPHLGERIAQGIGRKPAGDHRDGGILGGAVITSWTTWSLLVAELGHEGHRHELELTRERAGRSGVKRFFGRG